MLKPLGLVALIALASSTIACAQTPTQEEQGSATSHITGGDDDTTDDADAPTDKALMRAILQAAKDDVAELALADTNDNIEFAAVHPEFGLRPSTIKFDLDGLSLFGFSACSVLRPLKIIEHPFFFGGFQGTGTAGVQLDVGVEAVVDVYNLQAGVFTYKGGGISGAISISGGAYTGIGGYRGAARQPNLVDTWSGAFVQASGSLGIEKFLSVNAGLFSSTDRTVVGAAVGAAAGIGVDLGAIVDASVGANDYAVSAGKTRIIFGAPTSDGTAHLADARAVTAAVLKVSPGVTLGNAFGLISRQILTNFLIEAILNAKSSNTSLSALCPG
jgi:hypothetical protein